MKRLFALVAFLYHYWAYQIPFWLMKKHLHGAIGAFHDEAEFKRQARKWSACAKVVIEHQAKCDHYRAIFEGT